VIKLLVKLFIKDSENVTDKNVRVKYGVLGGAVGIACNLLLFVVKFIIGMMMNSIAIISESMNNLSDSGASIVAVVGTKLSNMRPDKEHPYGHGRIEYISSLIVSFIIMLVGFELMKSSYSKLISPEEIEINLVMMGILALSIPVKLWMYSYNRYLGKKVNLSVLLAASRDSINDVISTTAVIVTTLIGGYFNIPILDGVVGIVVSFFVMYSGFGIARETVGVLLGGPPDKELVEGIEGLVLAGEGIVGVHDLVVHDYGPGRVMASVHAEVPDDSDIIRVHEVIDDIEKQAQKELDVELVIHMDPISVNNERVNMMREIVGRMISDVSEELSFHDFRMTDGDDNINLIFDVVVPVDMKPEERAEKIAKIKNRIKAYDSRFSTVINVDNAY